MKPELTPPTIKVDLCKRCSEKLFNTKEDIQFTVKEFYCKTCAKIICNVQWANRVGAWDNETLTGHLVMAKIEPQLHISVKRKTKEGIEQEERINRICNPDKPE